MVGLFAILMFYNLATHQNDQLPVYVLEDKGSCYVVASPFLDTRPCVKKDSLYRPGVEYELEPIRIIVNDAEEQG